MAFSWAKNMRDAWKHLGDHHIILLKCPWRKFYLKTMTKEVEEHEWPCFVCSEMAFGYSIMFGKVRKTTPVKTTEHFWSVQFTCCIRAKGRCFKTSTVPEILPLDTFHDEQLCPVHFRAVRFAKRWVNCHLLSSQI